MNTVKTNQGRYVSKCECCSAHLGETINRIDRPMSRGNPYPNDVVVCDKAECVKWAEDAVATEWQSMREHGDD